MAKDQGRGFIAVHVGAGYHSPTNSQLYKEICKQACIQAVALLKQKKSALEVTKAAIISLENSPWTNAGTGSNLTIKGTVECDASVMDGNSLQYGAVGAMSGIKNPILVAESLLKTQMQGNMSLGRIPPSTMVGDGATEWAKRKGIPSIPSEELITDATRRQYLKHKRKLDMLEESPSKYKRTKMEKNNASAPQTNGSSDVLHDTVGAVCIDHTGTVVSAVSSGGIVLKQPGRLGQAALYGCGCWAENLPDSECGIAVSTSGCGEHLTKTFLAKECGECLKHQDDATSAVSKVFLNKFLGSPFLRNIAQKLGGALVLKTESSKDEGLDVEVLWAHTTDSMCLAYMSTEDNHPKALVSRLPEDGKCGQSFVVQSKHFKLNAKEGKE